MNLTVQTPDTPVATNVVAFVNETLGSRLKRVSPGIELIAVHIRPQGHRRTPIYTCSAAVRLVNGTCLNVHSTNRNVFTAIIAVAGLILRHMSRLKDRHVSQRRSTKRVA